MFFQNVLALALNDLDDHLPQGERPSYVLLDLIDRRCQQTKDQQADTPSPLSELDLQNIEVIRKTFRETIWQLRQGFGPPLEE